MRPVAVLAAIALLAGCATDSRPGLAEHGACGGDFARVWRAHRDAMARGTPDAAEREDHLEFFRAITGIPTAMAHSYVGTLWDPVVLEDDLQLWDLWWERHCVPGAAARSAFLQQCPAAYRDLASPNAVAANRASRLLARRGLAAARCLAPLLRVQDDYAGNLDGETVGDTARDIVIGAACADAPSCRTMQGNPQRWNGRPALNEALARLLDESLPGDATLPARIRQLLQDAEPRQLPPVPALFAAPSGDPLTRPAGRRPGSRAGGVLSAD